jgi:Amidase
MQQGLLVPATTYLKAQPRRTLLMRDLDQLFRQAAFLATPSAATPAPKLDAGPSEIGAPTGALRVSLRRFTQPFNLTSSPAITVPCGFSRDGLPIGLQLIGRPFDEARLLNLAFAYDMSTIPPGRIVTQCCKHALRRASGSSRGATDLQGMSAGSKPCKASGFPPSAVTMVRTSSSIMPM